MNPLENKFESLTDERLNFLENVKDGDFVFCDGTENPARFIHETVANILEGDAKHIVIYFQKTVATKKAKNIAKRIGIAVKAADRSKAIETVYEVPTDLFALLKKEVNFTDKKRFAVVQAFLKQLDALRRALPMNTNIVEFLEQNLRGWDKKWIEEAFAYSEAPDDKEWEIPIIVTMDATEMLKLRVEQIARLSN